MDCVRIERLENGYTVSLDDPAIVKANRAPSVKTATGYKSTPYRDPRKEYAFKTVEEVMAFLGKNLDKALVCNEYESSFDDAIEAGKEED